MISSATGASRLRLGRRGLGLLICLAVLQSAPVSAQTLRRNAQLAPSLFTLSRQLADLQAVLERDYGVNEILVGGGSSRSILDTLYFGRDFVARDIDVFIVAGRRVTRQYAAGMAKRLQSAQAGLEVRDLEARRRVNDALPVGQRHRYTAGYGFFLDRPAGAMVDISIFHSPSDLAINGCLNIDRIMIRIPRGQTLAGVLEQMRGKSYGQVLAEGRIIDRHRGYEGWQRNQLKPVDPATLQLDPVLWSVRLARSYGKAGYNELPPDVIKLLRGGKDQRKVRSRAVILQRNIKRLLKDGRAEAELKMAMAPGMLQKNRLVRKLLGPPREWQLDRLRARTAAD